MKIIQILGALLSFLTLGIPLDASVQAKEAWVLNQMEEMDLDEKIGQLLIIPAGHQFSEAHQLTLKRVIQQYRPGGLIMKQGTLEGQIDLINTCQQLSKRPLIVTLDAEWGLSMRISDALRFPRNLTLGAIGDNHLLYQFGREVANQCLASGAHVDYAPVADVNSNSKNPVINDRSFGDHPENVAEKAVEVMRGMQDGGIIACGKHFIGHGDTDVDSQLGLPLILHHEERLNQVELYPFKQLINEGVKSMMVAHLVVPALDGQEKRPSTLSKNIVTGLLKEELGFKGWVFPDALNMKGLDTYTSVEEIAIQTLLAGCDVLLYGSNSEEMNEKLLKDYVPRAFFAVKQAVISGRIPEKLIDEKVRKILTAKYDQNLRERPTPLQYDQNRFFSEPALNLKRHLYRAAITLVKNEGVLPVSPASSVTHIQLGHAPEEAIQEAFNRLSTGKMNQYAYFLDDEAEPDLKILDEIDFHDTVIVSLLGMKRQMKANFGISAQKMKFLKRIIEKRPDTVLMVFGSPYSLELFPFVANLMLAYEDDPDAQIECVKAIYGIHHPEGRLPVETAGFSSGWSLEY